MTGTAAEAPARELSDAHRAYLTGHAIRDEVIDSHGIWSSGDWIVFPWQDGDFCTTQRRIWPEPEGGLPDGAGKYLWEKDEPLHFTAWRPLAGSGPVIIAEGTKQSLAVASWAPPEYAVYGMAGCNGWTRADLSRFEGHQVLIMLDADTAGNLKVYTAGEKLAARLKLEGADPAFIPSPSGGKNGIDDYLATVAPGRRTIHLERLFAQAAAKPAERRPAPKPDEAVPDTSQRPMVIVNKDRLAVIREILWHMKQQWNGTALFCYGGVLTRLRGSTTEPLDKDSFVRWMAEAVSTFRYKPPGLNTPGTYEAAWPEPQTIGALLASGDEFAPLAGVSRTPFARPDGTICFKNGWDWDPAAGTGSRVVLVTGNSGMDRLDIPSSPGQAEAAAAARYLLCTWLGDMPWRDDASRANALALILTPFLRGIVPLVPLAVISGLQMGVGKNLLADCISLMTTGENVQPMPWTADDDDEIRKQILSSFRAGSPLVCFDEAHVLGGPALTRAITATTYADRILGVSKIASYPNRVTWMSLGNQVTVLADMSRRAYYIELYPERPDPQDRDESEFVIPDLRTWTEQNRPELVTAALVLIRAWFTAGQPACPRGSLMGSFEPWDKMVSGILGYAGIDGFLSNLGARRAERDTTSGFWSDHLAWLREKFGTGEFTALDVKTRAMAAGSDWDAPPHLDEAGDRGFTRNLGVAYARNQDRWFGPLRIIKAGMARGTKGRWQVQSREEAGIVPVLHSLHPLPVGEYSTIADLGGMKRMKYEESEISDNTGFPATGGVDEVDEGDEVSTPTCHARAGARAHTRTREGEGAGSSSPSSTSSIPGLFADLETGSSDELFTYTQRDGSGFVRLAGMIVPGGPPVITDARGLLGLLPFVLQVTGHNFLGFDALALAWHCSADWDQLAPKVRDTELIARQYDPPRSRETHSQDRYDLDAVAAMLGLPGKTDDLKRLARQHGGFDRIPLDDPEYRAYLEGDLRATMAVAGRLGGYYDSDPYLPREHAMAALNGRMSLNGFAVDRALLDGRLADGEQRKRQALQVLHDVWGLPLTRTVTRGRGSAKRELEEAVTSPLSTDAGRAWLAGQWERYGIPEPPRTAKTGKLALGEDDLARIRDDPACPGSLRDMLALMGIVTGTRTVYQNAMAHLAPDGRVHPRISMRQASGRSSTTDPGLTVFGKHEGRHVERDIFVPDEGHVLFSADLKQVDMRGIAGHCQDPAYMELFGPGRDAHAEIAGMLSITRQQAKAYGHGWNYGLGPKRMIASGNDPETVYAFCNGMEARFPVLCGWREQVRARAAAGEILDSGFGRRMRADPQRAYTVGPALMGQGSAGDIMKEVLLRLDARAPELRPYYRVMVHDEQVFSVPEADAAEIIETVREAFTWSWHDTPILCDINGPGRSWGEISAK